MSERKSTSEARQQPAIGDNVPAVVPRRSVAGERAQNARAVVAGTSRRMKHGVYSVDSVLPEVLDELNILYARAPWIDPIRDGIVAEQLARLVVRLRRLDLALLEDPTSLSLTSLSARTEGQLLRTADALGLTPRASASLGIAHLDGKARLRKEAEQHLAQYADKPRRKR